MTTPVDALEACLRLMERGRSHPDDIDRWKSTMQASRRILQRNQPANHAAGPIAGIALAIIGPILVVFVVWVLG